MINQKKKPKVVKNDNLIQFLPFSSECYFNFETTIVKEALSHKSTIYIMNLLLTF